MKSNGNGNLQKQYNKLTPRERMALILAAMKRGDETERRALTDSAPRVRCMMPDYAETYDVLQLMALAYLVNQLNRAWSIATLAHVGEENDEAYRAAKIAAYVFCVQADAWRAFCAELEMDPDALTAGFADALFNLEFAERIAREFAFTFDEAQAETRRKIGEDADAPITVERALEDLRALFNRHTTG